LHQNGWTPGDISNHSLRTLKSAIGANSSFMQDAGVCDRQDAG
jgi:hypothetical protein